MTSGLGTAALLSPQRGTAADRNSAETQHRHPDSADGAKTNRASEYGIMVTVEPVGDPAARIPRYA